MRKIKIKLIALSIVAVMVTFLSQGTVAYYQTVGTATNVVTSGDIELVIHEMTGQGTEFPKEGVYIIPGDVVSKEVNIENACAHPFYLRVKIVYGIDSTELSAEDCFKLNINDEYWENYDGWYYYKGIVNPGEFTPNVFSHVEIVGSKVDNNYIGQVLNLTVKAQAVQSENNPIADNDYTSVVGWPAEEEPSLDNTQNGQQEQEPTDQGNAAEGEGA